MGGATAYLGGATAYLGSATAYLADSDNKASLSSSETVLELPTGTEIGKKYIQKSIS